MSALKPWGILMQAPMVLALLDGRKTVTRRTSKRWAGCGVGRELWVREKWRTAAALDGFSPKQIAQKALDAGYLKPWAPMHRLADGGNGHTLEPWWQGWGKTRPAIHMPEWASRIRRRAVSVTREEWPGVPVLSQAEAEREGFDSPDAFAALWVEINGPVGGVVYRIEMQEVLRG